MSRLWQNKLPIMKHLSRRQFLKTSALAAGTLAFSARSWAQVAGANSDVRVAVLGLNGRGKNHVASLSAIQGGALLHYATGQRCAGKGQTTQWH